MANRIDPLMDAVHASGCGPFVDGPRAHPVGDALLKRHDAVLSLRESEESPLSLPPPLPLLPLLPPSGRFPLIWVVN
jgi:hypothetical protein